MNFGLAGSSGLLVLVALLQTDVSGGDGEFVTGSFARLEPQAANDRALLDDDVVAGCTNCHRDNLSLAKFEPDELAQVIGAIVRQDVDHMVPISAMSDEDLAALAQALAEPDSSR